LVLVYSVELLVEIVASGALEPSGECVSEEEAYDRVSYDTLRSLPYLGDRAPFVVQERGDETEPGAPTYQFLGKTWISCTSANSVEDDEPMLEGAYEVGPRATVVECHSPENPGYTFRWNLRDFPDGQDLSCLNPKPDRAALPVTTPRVILIGVKRLNGRGRRIGVGRLPERVDSSSSAVLIGSAEMVEKPGERRGDVS
jgi:hypothetical protein